MGGKIGPLHGRTANLNQFGRLPAVDAQQRHGEAEFAGLFADEGSLGVVARHKDALDAGGLDGGELSAEVLVSFAVFLL